MRETTIKSKENQMTIGLGDLEKTVTLQALMHTPFPERNEVWRAEFLRCLPSANLKLGQPEVVIGIDGFPYIRLETVQANESFQAYVITQQLPVLLGQGFGIVINPQSDRLDWLFSYGDMVNLDLHKTFYLDESLFSNKKENIAIGKDEKILVGQPSDLILPLYLRRQLKEYLLHAGVKLPKTLLIARNYEDEKLVSQDLVFNITPQQFASEKAYQDVMATIAWFLPKHYSFMGINEMEIDNGFQPL